MTDKEEIEKGWHIEISEEFMEELDHMGPEQKKEVLDLIRGLQQGTIDPLSIETPLCGWCGNEMDHVPLEGESTACKKCQRKLV